MDQLALRFSDARVFAQSAEDEAFDSINGTDYSCLAIIGHSMGGVAAIDLAGRLSSVNLLVQIDSYDPWTRYLPNRSSERPPTLPASVTTGVNYYQISTGGATDFQGQKNVTGSKDYEVEDLYGVPAKKITHTQIDNARFERNEADYRSIFEEQPDLHDRIVDLVAEACPEK